MCEGQETAEAAEMAGGGDMIDNVSCVAGSTMRYGRAVAEVQAVLFNLGTMVSNLVVRFSLAGDRERPAAADAGFSGRR